MKDAHADEPRISRLEILAVIANQLACSWLPETQSFEETSRYIP
jgi:hypothetical protein